ncbi:hypothetical protein A2U01_0064188, partial [Trifolium medium]|nr:hypothetical protein [Trifolium medium]
IGAPPPVDRLLLNDGTWPSTYYDQ